MPKHVFDQYRSELTQGRPDTWYDPIRSYLGTLPEWDTTLSGTSDDATYLLSELRKDITPVEGPVRSGVRSTQEWNKMMGLLDEGDYPGAAAAGIWSGIEAADFGLSAYGLGILATPLDLARAIKRGTKLKAGEGISGKHIGGDLFDRVAPKFTNEGKVLLSKNTDPDEGPFRITYLDKNNEPYYHDDFDTLKSAEKELLEIGADFKKLSPDKVVPVSPDAVPKLMNRVPVINPQDLVGKRIFQIPADLTDAGVIYTGIDSSKLTKGEPLYGGPKFPDLEDSRNANVVWAVSDKGAAGFPKLIENSDYAVIVAMGTEAHKSNTSITNSMLGNMDAYIRDGRIGKRNLQRLNKLVKKKTGNVAHKDLQNFPGFESKDYRKFVKGLTFEARARIAEQLGSAAGQKLGAPNINKILRKTQDPSTYGLGRSDALLLIEIDKGPNNIVKLGEHPGTTKHPSYSMAFKGKIVGKFATPVSYDTLFPDYVSTRLKEGKSLANIERASNLEQPIVTITQDIANNLPTTPYQHIQSSRQAHLALEAAKDNWKTTMMPVGRGGASPTDFINAIRNSDASATLTEYSVKEIQQGVKNGTFNVYQLGGKDSQVFFGIKDTDYAADYGFIHPDLGPNERAIVGVVNNEPGARGIAAPGVMGKAIQEGATALDAFAVPSKKYPRGFLPKVYNDYGFVELGRLPFEEKYYSATQLRDLKEYWRSTGWDESLGMPEMVFMKWKGDNAIRSDAIRLINENSSLKPGGQTTGISETAETYSGQPTGPAHGRPPGTSPVNNPGGTGGGIRDRTTPHSGQRFSDVLSELSLLSPNQLQNLGLTPESLLY